MSLSDIMSAAGLTSWAEIALILCFVTFTLIVVWVFGVRRKTSYEHLSELPLDDDSAAGRTPVKGGRSS
jgi:cbb3-type cytochrome oxidase subunit 3